VPRAGACDKFCSLPGSCIGSTICSGSGGKQHPVNSTSMSQRRARDLLSLGCFPPSPSQGAAQFGPNVRSPESTAGLGRGAKWGENQSPLLPRARACGKFRSLPGSCIGSTICSGSGGKQHPVNSTSMSQRLISRPPVARLLSTFTIAGCCTIRTQRPLTGIYRRPWTHDIGTACLLCPTPTCLI